NEVGLDHNDPMPQGVPGPDEAPTMAERLAGAPDPRGGRARGARAAARRGGAPPVAERLAGYPARLADWSRLPRPIDVRYVTDPGWLPAGDRRAADRQRGWMRIDGTLPEDPLVHACAVTLVWA